MNFNDLWKEIFVRFMPLDRIPCWVFIRPFTYISFMPYWHTGYHFRINLPFFLCSNIFIWYQDYWPLWPWPLQCYQRNPSHVIFLLNTFLYLTSSCKISTSGGVFFMVLHHNTFWTHVFNCVEHKYMYMSTVYRQKTTPKWHNTNEIIIITNTRNITNVRILVKRSWW